MQDVHTLRSKASAITLLEEPVPTLREPVWKIGTYGWTRTNLNLLNREASRPAISYVLKLVRLEGNDPPTYSLKASYSAN